MSEDHTEIPYVFEPRLYGVMRPSMHVEPVPADPSKADYCTRTIATMGDNECRVNRFTKELFNRRGRELWYVGVSGENDERDVKRWVEWVIRMRMDD